MSVEDTWSWPEGRLDGRAAFQETLRAALAAAGPQPGAELLLADDDFLDWPLGEALVVASLQRWCQGGGTVLLLARRFDEAMRQHPRLVRWRALWSHRVQARQPCAEPRRPLRRTRPVTAPDRACDILRHHVTGAGVVDQQPGRKAGSGRDPLGLRFRVPFDRETVVARAQDPQDDVPSAVPHAVAAIARSAR